MTEIGDELRKELAECTINIANLIEQKNAEIARLRTWLGDSEMTVSKLLAALEAVMPIAEAFRGRTDKEPALQMGRKALAEQRD